MFMKNNDELFAFIAPKIEPPELRVYYDELGKIVTYTCEKLEGSYLIIDKLTYAQNRYDLRVIDGKLSSINPKSIISKLKPSDSGIRCATQDISIVVDDAYVGSTTYWKLKTHELK